MREVVDLDQEARDGYEYRARSNSTCMSARTFQD